MKSKEIIEIYSRMTAEKYGVAYDDVELEVFQKGDKKDYYLLFFIEKLNQYVTIKVGTGLNGKLSCIRCDWIELQHFPTKIIESVCETCGCKCLPEDKERCNLYTNLNYCLKNTSRFFD